MTSAIDTTQTRELTEYEARILREIDGQLLFSKWHAGFGVCLTHLRAFGLIESHRDAVTPAGRAWLDANPLEKDGEAEGGDYPTLKSDLMFVRNGEQAHVFLEYADFYQGYCKSRHRPQDWDKTTGRHLGSDRREDADPSLDLILDATASATNPDELVTQASGDGAGAAAFDPTKPFTTRDGREVPKLIDHVDDGDDFWVGRVYGCPLQTWRKPSGKSCIAANLDLVNTPATPSPDGDAETDAAFLERMKYRNRSNNGFSRAMFEKLLSLARCGARRPEAAPSPATSGWIVTDVDGALFRTWGDAGFEWTSEIEQAVRYARFADAEKVHAEDEDAWGIVALPPSSSPAESAPPVTSDPVAVALIWAMDEIDVLSNKLTGFAYPQGMMLADRNGQQVGYAQAVRARAALRTSSKGGA